MSFHRYKPNPEPFKGQQSIPVTKIWDALFKFVLPIWPDRVKFQGEILGDVWPCPSLAKVTNEEGGDLVPFHKLTQWLCYSLLEPFRNVAGIEVTGDEMTGLPEV